MIVGQDEAYISSCGELWNKMKCVFHHDVMSCVTGGMRCGELCDWLWDEM